MAQYVTRTGAVTAIRTSSALAGQGSISSPGGITVPSGTSQIVQVIATFEDNPLTTAGGHVFFLRIAGNGLSSTGEVDLPIGGSGSELLTTGAAGTQKAPVIIPTSIPVTVGNTVTLNADTNGTGTPTARVGVTLVFA